MLRPLVLVACALTGAALPAPATTPAGAPAAATERAVALAGSSAAAVAAADAPALDAAGARAAAQDSPVAAPAPERAPDAGLQALFAAAQQDPRQLPELITRASAQLALLPPEQARTLADTLEPFSRRAFFTPLRFEGMERLGLTLHTVKQGENPTVIAARYRISAGLLPYLNQGFDERRLGVGQQLKVLDLSRAGLELRVERALYRLAAFADLPAGRALLLHAPVGLGAAATPTPAGSTTIVKRVLDPQWTDPVTKRVFAPGDPGNVLGGYWIALDAAGLGGRSGIGLHGYTGAPPADWIAQPSSMGCLRLLEADVDRVYHVALEGTPVVLR